MHRARPTERTSRINCDQFYKIDLFGNLNYTVHVRQAFSDMYKTLRLSRRVTGGSGLSLPKKGPYFCPRPERMPRFVHLGPFFQLTHNY